MVLLEFAISVCPDLLKGPSRLYQTRLNASKCDNVSSIYNSKSLINIFRAINVTDNDYSASSNVSENYDLSSSFMMQCPEMFPLILICNSEKDATVNATALQILARNAHKSISRWIMISNSQLPTAIWTVRTIYNTASLSTVYLIFRLIFSSCFSRS